MHTFEDYMQTLTQVARPGNLKKKLKTVNRQNDCFKNIKN